MAAEYEAEMKSGQTHRSAHTENVGVNLCVHPNESKPLFPRVWLIKREMNFSFSGLKSSIKREVDKRIEEK
ncbi:hypothetical protein ACFLY2_01685 [Patescibacteria group bacterium]